MPFSRFLTRKRKTHGLLFYLLFLQHKNDLYSTDSKRCEFQSENSLKRNPQDNDRSEEEKRSYLKIVEKLCSYLEEK